MMAGRLASLESPRPMRLSKEVDGFPEETRQTGFCLPYAHVYMHAHTDPHECMCTPTRTPALPKKTPKATTTKKTLMLGTVVW